MPVSATKDIALPKQFVHPYLRRFVLLNPTDFIINANFFIQPQSVKDQFLNTRLPVGGLNFSVRPQSSAQFLCLKKLLINNNKWVDFEWNITVNYIENKGLFNK